MDFTLYDVVFSQALSKKFCLKFTWGSHKSCTPLQEPHPARFDEQTLDQNLFDTFKTYATNVLKEEIFLRI